MRRKLLILFMISLAFVACGKKETAVSEGGAGTAFESEMAQRGSTKFLAYEHDLSIDISEANLLPAYQNTLSACINDKENNCTILDAKISSGYYSSARIHLRIKPNGVKGIIETASSNGRVSNQSTHVEDLAMPIIDNEKRLKMLESHQERLLSLQDKAANDIDSLIKISEELSKVQTELENAKGQNVHLLQRVNMDIVKINFIVDASRSFWKPITRSLTNFSGNLSEGISYTIQGVAYLLPWAIVIVLVVFVIRYIWRRGKKGRG